MNENLDLDCSTVFQLLGVISVNYILLCSILYTLQIWYSEYFNSELPTNPKIEAIENNHDTSIDIDVDILIIIAIIIIVTISIINNTFSSILSPTKTATSPCNLGNLGATVAQWQGGQRHRVATMEL